MWHVTCPITAWKFTCHRCFGTIITGQAQFRFRFNFVQALRPFPEEKLAYLPRVSSSIPKVGCSTNLIEFTSSPHYPDLSSWTRGKLVKIEHLRWLLFYAQIEHLWWLLFHARRTHCTRKKRRVYWSEKLNVFGVKILSSRLDRMFLTNLWWRRTIVRDQFFEEELLFATNSLKSDVSDHRSVELV